MYTDRYSSTLPTPVGIVEATTRERVVIMATSGLTPAGARILDAASALFYDQGIHAVGVDAIARAAGVTKKTLYDRFGSKAELIAAYLRARDERWRDWLTRSVESRTDDPRERLLATFDALGSWMRAENPRGCAFVNAFAELPDPDDPGHRVVAGQKAWLLGYLTDLAAEAGLPGPKALGRRLLLLHEGATIAYGTGVVPRAAAEARAVAELLVAA
jgi:AcrR family transcriptional regulator